MRYINLHLHYITLHYNVGPYILGSPFDLTISALVSQALPMNSRVCECDVSHQRVTLTASSLDIAPLTILDSGALQPRK